MQKYMEKDELIISKDQEENFLLVENVSFCKKFIFPIFRIL